MRRVSKYFSSIIKKRFDPTTIGLSENFSLISYASLKGWGCKVPQGVLFQYLKDIGDGNIGRETPDCSVTPVKGNSEYVTVSTTDFFYPLVEDPYKQGQIACCNVLSDLYSMGVTSCDSILMILGVSTQMKEKEREVITKHIMKGFNDKALEAGTNITGGQSVMNPWPIIGGTAFSVIPKKTVIFPNNCRKGDVLILTKPLGTQVAVNVAQWLIENNEKFGKFREYLSEEEIWNSYHTAEISMSKLNKNAAELMKNYRIGACTDITGFGIKGHIENLAVAQKESLNFYINSLPIIKNTELINNNVLDFKLIKGYSAETSGGLLIALSPNDADSYLKEFRKLDKDSWGWIVGEVTSGERKVEILERPLLIPV